MCERQRSVCKRFTFAHRVAGTVSGVDVAIYDVDELWFSVDIEVSERNQNLALNMGRNRSVYGCGCANSGYWCSLAVLYIIKMN